MGEKKKRSPCLSQRKEETPSARRSSRDVTAVARDCTYSQAKICCVCSALHAAKTPPSLSSLPTTDPVAASVRGPVLVLELASGSLCPAAVRMEQPGGQSSRTGLLGALCKFNYFLHVLFNFFSALTEGVSALEHLWEPSLFFFL